MKKQQAIALYEKEKRELIDPLARMPRLMEEEEKRLKQNLSTLKRLRRNHLYKIQTPDGYVIFLLTHFDKDKIKAKPLAHTKRKILYGISNLVSLYIRTRRRGTIYIPFDNFRYLQICHFPVEDLPLYLNDATKFFEEYFRKGSRDQ